MNQDRWRRAEDLFHAALERPPETRRAFLDEACAGDSELRRQLETLVLQDERAGSFLEQPVMAAVTASPGARTSLAGCDLGPYRILSLLGAGGMGEVYRAHDNKLGRDVAIKTLPPEFARDPARLARLRREARTLAALNHPNIAAIYGLEESGDEIFLVLELVEGEALEGPLPVTAALGRARQVATALEAAHEHGIVHRDLKPANIKVTQQGAVKVLDFGLAKGIWGGEGKPGLPPTAGVTRAGSVAGHVVGTPGYMSPEQARGLEVDQRTDIWAFGCLLYELLAGKHAYSSDTASDTIAAVLDHEPDWQALPRATPASVRALLRACLDKDLSRRLDNIADARRTLEAAERARNRWRLVAAALRQPRFAIPAAAMLLVLGLLGTRFYQHQARVRWVRERAIPEASRLLDARDWTAAFRLIRRAEAALPNDPTLERIHHDNAYPTSFRTTPPGAEVWATGYDPADEDWLRLGVTPFTTRKLFWGHYRFRVVKPGFRTVLGAGDVRGGTTLAFDLDADGAIPPDMVRVPGGTVSVLGLDGVKVAAFLIDRHEVTNREFKEFVDRGGYEKQEYWNQDFLQGGSSLPWKQAMPIFRDSTGRPGPSDWKVGAYPPGHDDHPVSGVSWYEAAAYAAYAGKQLPTIYQWQQAASPGFFVAVAKFSNLGGAGPAPVGSHKGLNAYGTLDMAGNVKEWCWNGTGRLRYIRGGAWNEPVYMFSDLDARSPWDRSAQNGIRCVRDDVSGGSELEAPVTRPIRDFSKETPASDQVFQLYERLYAYDPTELDPRVEGVESSSPYWRREKISFSAAYGNERVLGYMYIPKQATPPYQAIIYADPGMSLRLASPEPEQEPFFDFVVKSGRAFLLPVLKGQYQRRYLTPPAGPNAVRDRLILESKDFRRSIDYLASRADVDRHRLGVLGYSRGGGLLPVLAVGDRRLKAAALASVGLPFGRVLPEADPFNFVPRFRVPTLMAGGRYDFVLPLETSLRPMFRLLGPSDEHKRLWIWDGGHGDLTVAAQEWTAAALQWFDRYLGPVKK